MESSAHPLHVGLAVLCRSAARPEGGCRLPPLGRKLLHRPPRASPARPIFFHSPSYSGHWHRSSQSK